MECPRPRNFGLRWRSRPHLLSKQLAKLQKPGQLAPVVVLLVQHPFFRGPGFWGHFLSGCRRTRKIHLSLLISLENPVLTSSRPGAWFPGAVRFLANRKRTNNSFTATQFGVGRSVGGNRCFCPVVGVRGPLREREKKAEIRNKEGDSLFSHAAKWSLLAPYIEGHPLIRIRCCCFYSSSWKLGEKMKKTSEAASSNHTNMRGVFVCGPFLAILSPRGARDTCPPKPSGSVTFDFPKGCLSVGTGAG